MLSKGPRKREKKSDQNCVSEIPISTPKRGWGSKSNRKRSRRVGSSRSAGTALPFGAAYDTSGKGQEEAGQEPEAAKGAASGKGTPFLSLLTTDHPVKAETSA